MRLACCDMLNFLSVGRRLLLRYKRVLGSLNHFFSHHWFILVQKMLFLAFSYLYSCLQVKLAVTWVCFLAAVFLPSLSLLTSPFICAAPVTRKSHKYPSYRASKIWSHVLRKRNFSIFFARAIIIIARLETIFLHYCATVKRRNSPNNSYTACPKFRW